MNSVHEVIAYQKANRIYDDFITAIKSNNNEKIKNSTLIKIFDEIVKRGKECENIIPKNTTLYRARIVKDFNQLPILQNPTYEDYFSGFDYEGSKEPPPQFTEEGRCNRKGMPLLYLAKCKYTACAEVKPEFTQIISLATFRTKRDIRIADFCTDRRWASVAEYARSLNCEIGSLLTFVMLQFTGSTGKFYDYTVSQYITDYFKNFDYRGIAYRSAQTGLASYAIFLPYEHYIEFMDTKLIYTDRKQFHFVQYDNLERIGNDNYKEVADDIIKQEKIRIIRSRRISNGKTQNDVDG